MKITHGRGYVFGIMYHIVWCVKYRHQVLISDIDASLKSIIQEICSQNNIEIVELNTDKDHIHMLISCTPQHYIPDFMKALKGVSARLLFKNHPKLKSQLWGGNLWNPSYFITTVGETSEDQIKQYIQQQGAGK